MRSFVLLSLLFALPSCVEDNPGRDDGGPVLLEDGGDQTDASREGEDGSIDDAGADPADGAHHGDGALPADGAVPDVPVPDAALDDRRFSFFVTSLEAIQRLSGSNDGYGGDLGGLEGADQICQTIGGEAGAGHKTWRAFLSVTDGGGGQPVHAIDRIGEGPWYDANERLVAEDLAGLLNARPAGDAQSVNDLPDEWGVPISVLGDAHDVITGSNQQGQLARNDRNSTCNDWTSSDAIGLNLVMCGHSFPRMGPGGGRPGGGGRGGAHWLSDHPLRGCTPGINLLQNGPGEGTCIGCSGGYGAIYCFALSP